jgi:hypothetical protein
MEEQLSQRTIEYFFDKYGVTNPDIKARILPQVTDIIYDYNMLVVNLEKETDEYKKNQIINDIKEVEDKIQETFEDESKK